MMDQEPDVLELLIRHELALKELYELFAALFPHRLDFWRGIAGDEQRHAEWLGNMRSREGLENWLLSDNRLRPQAIRSSMGYVEMQAAKARKGGFTLLEALSISKDLENALLERQFGRISDSVPAEIRSVLADLAADTERHRKAMAETLEAERRRMR